ncbi:MAG: potassium/proton antiporter [Acidimicrobiales bacterium]|nr:potassium/proton antiporter [Acidimicrobiales bacterium]
MELHLAVDDIVLLAAAVIVVGVLMAGLAGRVRVPSLLVFLVLGMVVADDGLALVEFDDAELAQSVSVVALVLILFEGGLSATWKELRTVAVPAALLASVGVAITAGVVGAMALIVLDVPTTTALLIGAVVASTDAAAVMSVLRGSAVPNRARALLEAESGLNDPVAVLLTVGLLETWAGDASGLGWVGFAVQQLAGGVVAGLAVGIGGAWLAQRARLAGGGLFAVLASGLAGLAYGAATQVGGSGLLAVYLAGLLLGHRMPRHRHALRTVHEGFAFAAQMALFLLLGLLVFPSDLVEVAPEGVLLAAVLVFVARPVAEAVSLPWFGIPRNELAFVAWAGLRGGVPIVLATFPLTVAYPDATLVFDLVFFVVLLSVALQGATIALVARRLGLAADRTPATATVMGLDHVAADVVELVLEPTAGVVGHPLEAVPMPAGIRVSVLVRDDRTIVPDGATTLQSGDTLIVVAHSSVGAEHALEQWVLGPPA